MKGSGVKAGGSRGGTGALDKIMSFFWVVVLNPWHPAHRETTSDHFNFSTYILSFFVCMGCIACPLGKKYSNPAHIYKKLSIQILLTIISFIASRTG